MMIKFYHWYDAVLAALLAMLGFQSCDTNGDSPVEYGTPSVDYQVRGTVTDGESRPIRGIKVKVVEEYETAEGTLHEGLDSTLTDEQGAYRTRMLNAISLHEGLKLVVEDVDGPDNGGEFQGDTLALSGLQQRQVKKGSGNWYRGQYELTGDVSLKLK